MPRLGLVRTLSYSTCISPKFCDFSVHAETCGYQLTWLDFDHALWTMVASSGLAEPGPIVLNDETQQSMSIFL